MALPCHCRRSVLAAHHRLGRPRPDEEGPGHRALQKAIAIRRPEPGLIQHSDRGSQYASYDCRKVLKQHSILPSMSSKGNCYDNAMVETVFKTIKSELIWRTVFQTPDQAIRAIGEYIDGFYNPVRKHSALGYKSPIHFEVMNRNLEPKALQ